MKKYLELQFKIVFFNVEDIITQSIGTGTGDVYFDNELPIAPIGGSN